MWYVYILKSEKHNWFYTGMTNNLQNRFKMHNLGKVESTFKFLPLVLIHYEAYLNKFDAAKREHFFKSGWGKNWIKKNLENYFKNLGG